MGTGEVKWYFENGQEVERLGRILKSWERTPYRHYTGVKKKGVDCIHFLMRVYEEMGLLPPRMVKVPYYPPDWHLHKEEELLKSVFLNHPYIKDKVVAMRPDDPLDGDIVIMKYGKVDSHGGIFYGGHLWHAITRIGVQSSVYCDKMWAKRMRLAFRITA